MRLVPRHVAQAALLPSAYRSNSLPSSVLPSLLHSLLLSPNPPPIPPPPPPPPPTLPPSLSAAYRGSSCSLLGLDQRRPVYHLRSILSFFSFFCQYSAEFSGVQYTSGGCLSQLAAQVFFFFLLPPPFVVKQRCSHGLMLLSMQGRV